MSAQMNAAGQTLLKSFESCVLTAYWDPIGQCWTIGWGHTGPEVHEGITWTQAVADAHLISDLGLYSAQVANLIEVTLTPNEFSALVDFQYNTGALANSPGLVLINRGYVNFMSAWTEHFDLWIHDGSGNVIDDLVRRRAAEQKLFFTPEPKSA